MHERIITPNYLDVQGIKPAKPKDLTIPKYKMYPESLLRKKRNEAHHKKREYPIKHSRNLRKSTHEDFEVADIEKNSAEDFSGLINQDLTEIVMQRIEHALHRDQKGKPKGNEQKLKLASMHHNFSPLEKRKILDENYVFQKSKKRLKSEVALINQSDIRHTQIQIKRRQASRLRSDNIFSSATHLREQAEIPYHKAHRVTISVNKEEVEDNNSQEKIRKLRKLLFINPKGEGLKTGFMGNLFTKNGQNIKQLARFITGANLKDMEVLFYGKRDKKLNPEFITLSDENRKTSSLTNREMFLLFDGGRKEIPIARICSPSGKVLLEISFSYGKWDKVHRGIPDNHDGSWAEGEINFYYRQKKLEGKQIKKIFDRWLELS